MLVSSFLLQAAAAACSGSTVWHANAVQQRFAFEHWLSEVVHKPCRVVDCSLEGRCHKAGLLTLAGNASAHETAVRCAIAENSPVGSDVRYLVQDEYWSRLSCNGGCDQLVSQVAMALQPRNALWSVVFIDHVEQADPQVVANLILDFVEGGGSCKHSTADEVFSIDCSRVLLVLSTAFGKELIDETVASAPLPSSKLEKRARDRAQRWYHPSAVQDYGKNTRGRLLSNLRVALGESPASLLDAYITRAEAEAAAKAACDADHPSPAHMVSGAPDLSTEGPLGRLVGQSYVVRAINKTLRELSATTDGSLVSHLPEVFFFYGAPGLGKTFLAKLIAEAYHGSLSKPYFGSFKMQDYKDQRDQKRLTGAGCDLVGGGVPELEAYYDPGNRAIADSWAKYGGVGRPVLLFDEIEHGFDGVMNMLQNGVDGAWVYHREDPHDKSHCPQVTRPTAGSIIILTSNCYEEELKAATRAVKAEVLRYDDEQLESLSRRCAELCERHHQPCLVACEVEARMTSRIMKDALPCGIKKALEPFELDKFKDRFHQALFPFMELDEEQELAAMQVPLQELQREQKAKLNVTLLWTTAYPEHWLQTHASSASGSSLRDAINDMAQSKKRPGSVRSLLTQATADCTTHGERLRYLLLHASADGPTALHRCDGVRRTKEALPKHSKGSGGGRKGAAAEVASSLPAASPPTGGGAAEAGGGAGGKIASGPRAASRSKERSEEMLQILPEAPTEAPAAAVLQAVRDREAALQARLAALEQETAQQRARIAELERQNSHLRLLLSMALLSLAVLTLGLCYSLAAPLLLVGKVLLVHVAPAAMLVAAAAYAVVWVLCKYAEGSWIGAASCLGLEVARALSLAAVHSVTLLWQTGQAICSLLGWDPVRCLTALAGLVILMCGATLAGKWQRRSELREVVRLRMQVQETHATIRSLRGRAMALQLLVAGFRGRTRRLIAEKADLWTRLQAELRWLAPPTPEVRSPVPSEGLPSPSGSRTCFAGGDEGDVIQRREDAEVDEVEDELRKESPQEGSVASSFEPVDMNDA